MSAPVGVLVPLTLVRVPSLVGVARPGHMLVCRAGSWRHSGALHVTYRWERNRRLLPTARAARYRVTSADVGRRLACRIAVAARLGHSTRTTHALLVR